MQMIRRHDEFVNLGVGEMFGDFLPAFRNDFAPQIQAHFTVNNPSEQFSAIVGADGEKVSPQFAPFSVSQVLKSYTATRVSNRR